MKRWFIPAVVLGSGCGGASYTATSTAATPSPVADVFQCVREHLPTVSFKQTSFDVDAHRVTAQRYNDAVQRPDVRFRRIVDVLEFDIHPDSSGRTTIVVQSKTLAEYMTERGQTFVQEAASDSVRVAGQTVLAACSH